MITCRDCALPYETWPPSGCGNCGSAEPAPVMVDPPSAPAAEPEPVEETPPPAKKTSPRGVRPPRARKANP
jgi:hypothetical protein